MNYKRLLCTIINVMMVGVMITACGNKEASIEERKNDTSELKPYIIKFYSGGIPQKDLDKVLIKVNEYLKDKINAKLDLQQIDWSDYNSKMQVIIYSGEKYDLAFTSSWSNDYTTNAKKGAFLELNELMNKYGQDMLKVIDPKLISGNKIDGKLYAVPANKEIGQQRVFRFNKKYVDKYKIDITKLNTYESLEEALKIVKVGEPDMKSVFKAEASTVELNFDQLSGIPSVVMDIDAKENKFKNFFEIDKTQKFLQLMRKYYQAGYIRADAVGAGKNNTDVDKTGNWFVDISTTQPYAEKLWSASLGYEVVITPMLKPVINNSSVSGSMIGISVTAENPERDMMFLNLLNTDVYLRNLLNYGIEGEHYIKNNDGTITISQKGVNNYSVPGFTFGNIFNTYLTEGTPTDKWEKFKEFNETSIVAPTLGFDFNQESVKSEVSALNNVLDEYYLPLVTGTVDPTTYSKMAIDKLKASGIDKVITEAQKQFDAWKAKQ